MPGYSDARDWMSQIGSMGIMGGQQQSLLWQMLSMMGQLGPAMGSGQGPTSFAARAMGPSIMGGVFGGPTTLGIGGAIAGMMAQGQAQTAAGWAFPDILGAGGGGGGRGFGPAGAAGMAQFMGGMAGGGTSMADISQITAAAGSSGAFRGVTDVKEARAKLQEMVKTVTALSKELSATIEDVSTGMAQVRSMGYTSTAGQAGALRGLLSGSAASGMPLNQFTQFQAAMGQEGRLSMGIPLAAASGAAGRSMAHIGAALRSGSLSDEVLMNATGLGGQAGVVALASQIQGVSAQQLNRAQNQYALAAFIDPATGKLKQDMVNQFMQGAMDPNQVMQMASRNIGRVGGQAAWMGMQPQLMGQFQEMTGNMGGMGFAGMLMQRHGYDMDPTNPRNVAAYTRAIGLNPRNRQDIMQGQAFMEVQSRWGETQETIAASDRAANSQREVSKSINERMANASLVGLVDKSTSDYLDAASGPAERALRAVIDSGMSVLLGAQTDAIAAPVSALSSGAFTRPGAPPPSQSSQATASGRRVIRERKAALRDIRDPATRAAGARDIEQAEELVGLDEGELAVRRYGGQRMLTEDQERLTRSFWMQSEEEQNRLVNAASNGKIKTAAELKDQDFLGALASGSMDIGLYAEAAVGGVFTADEVAAAGGGLSGALNATRVRAERSRGLRQTAMGAAISWGTKGTQGVARPDLSDPGKKTSSQWVDAAMTAGGGIFGQGTVGAMGALQGDWEKMTQLNDYLQKLDPGKTGVTLKSIGDDLKWSSDVQKAIFGEAATSGKDIAVGDLTRFVTASGNAAVAATSERLLEGGWLSQESAESYGRAGAGKSKAARTFARAMTGAHGLLEAGDREGSLGAARRAITDITGLGDREFRQAEQTLAASGVTTTNELRELQQARKGGLTVAEMKGAFGEDWAKGMGLTGANASKETFEHSATLQRKAVDYWAGQTIPLGSATDAGRKAPLSDQLASTLTKLNETMEGMKNGLKLSEGTTLTIVGKAEELTVPVTAQVGVKS